MSEGLYKAVNKFTKHLIVVQSSDFILKALNGLTQP